MVTFKEKDTQTDIKKEIKKAGLSLAIIFSKEDTKKFELDYGDTVVLNNAEIIKKEIVVE